MHKYYRVIKDSLSLDIGDILLFLYSTQDQQYHTICLTKPFENRTLAINEEKIHEFLKEITISFSDIKSSIE